MFILILFLVVHFKKSLVHSLSTLSVGSFPAMLFPAVTITSVPSLLLLWTQNDMFAQLWMWWTAEWLYRHVIWCPCGELVACLRSGWLGHVRYKPEMNSSTWRLNRCAPLNSMVFTSLCIIFPKSFWAQVLSWVTSVLGLRILSWLWQYGWPAARVREVKGNTWDTQGVQTRKWRVNRSVVSHSWFKICIYIFV